MSLSELITQAGRIMADARDLFGSSPHAVTVDGVSINARSGVAQAGGQVFTASSGNASDGYLLVNKHQVSGLEMVERFDRDLNDGASAAAVAASQGRTGMDRIISSIHADASAPATPAGETAVIAMLRRRLRETEQLIAVSQRRNRRLETLFQRVSGGYAGYPGGGSPAVGGLALASVPGRPAQSARERLRGQRRRGRLVSHVNPTDSGLATKTVYDAARQHGYSPQAATTIAEPGSKQEMKAYAASQLARHGWSADEIGALDTLWEHESSWNPKAHNPSGASGIAQFMPYNEHYVLGNENQPWTSQIDQGLAYIADRYGSPSAAWAQYYHHAGGEGSY